MSNVRSYTDKQILTRAKSTHGFKAIPTGYWLCGIRSTEDQSDNYDDKFYLFKGETFICVTSGTTNPGKWGLLNFATYNPQGCAVVKADEWYYDLWTQGLHKGKMKAWVQFSDILFYRDNNKNDKSEEIGKVYKGKIGINFHTCTYEKEPGILKKFIGWIIGKWSEGCQVVNGAYDYYKIIELTFVQPKMSYCLLKEFEP
jgi:hypothetical protein